MILSVCIFCCSSVFFLNRDRYRRFFLSFLNLVPDFEEAVPGSCADSHPVLRDAQTANTIIVARKHSWKTTKNNMSKIKFRRLPRARKKS